MPVSIFNSDGLVPYKKWNFPGGEIGVKILDVDNLDQSDVYSIHVEGKPTSEDIFVALNLMDAIRQNTEIERKNIALYLAYLPYARQDRVCSKGESFALEVFIKTLCSSPDFGTLVVVDPHSEVSEHFLQAHLDDEVELVIIPQHKAFRGTNLFGNHHYDCYIAPDKGALVKLQAAPDLMFRNKFFLSKERKDGKVTVLDYTYDSILGKSIIIDDICDGGATFVESAKMLRRTQPNMTQLDLYVTHGIFSKGLDELKQHFDTIYVYNNMSEIVDPRLVTYK